MCEIKRYATGFMRLIGLIGGLKEWVWGFDEGDLNQWFVIYEVNWDAILLRV